MIYPNNELLSYIGIGDAYCLATEYINDEEYVEKVLLFDRYYSHPTYHASLAAGMYSDDTHMSIGCTEALLEKKINSITKLDFANKWVEVYQRNPRNGYSSGFQHILNSVSSGEELLVTLDNSSNKYGVVFLNDLSKFLMNKFKEIL